MYGLRHLLCEPRSPNLMHSQYTRAIVSCDATGKKPLTSSPCCTGRSADRKGRLPDL